MLFLSNTGATPAFGFSTTDSRKAGAFAPPLRGTAGPDILSGLISRISGVATEGFGASGLAPPSKKPFFQLGPRAGLEAAFNRGCRKFREREEVRIGYTRTDSSSTKGKLALCLGVSNRAGALTQRIRATQGVYLVFRLSPLVLLVSRAQSPGQMPPLFRQRCHPPTWVARLRLRFLAFSC